MKSAVGFASLVLGVCWWSLSLAAADQAWLDRSLPPEKRATALVAAMSQEEKFQQLKGSPGIVPELPQCFGGRHVPGIARLKIPTLRVTNGPVGIGQNDCVPQDTPNLPRGSLNSRNSAKATALPAALAMAASFDRRIATQFGNVVGDEARALALHVFEAPGVNMARSPRGGRNFEYFGEDPFLTGTLAVAEIRAIQSHGVIAMAKHIAANEQETDRTTVNEEVDDRTLHEIYLLPFEMAVKDGDVASVMCSYNILNGSQMCENRHILTDVLRGQWGFKGYVQSDFFAAKSLNTLRAGMDHEMPGYDLTIGNTFLGGLHDSQVWFTPEHLSAALASGEITQPDIDQALWRRYVQMFRLGIFDRPVVQTPIPVKRDGDIAAQIGAQAAVLLRNTGGQLPFHAKALRRVVIIGKADYAANPVVGGGGSSSVIPLETVSPLQGAKDMLAQLGSAAAVNLVIVNDENRNLADAVSAARAADAVILLAGSLSSEGRDQASIALPKQQDEMIAAIAAANPRTVLVLKDNAAVLMPWIDKVPAILEVWFPGQEDGKIVASLLFGQVNPSGKLPVTFPRAESDLPAYTPEQFPGLVRDGQRQVRYSEGLQIGYRWFDAKKIEPLYPFGYGLSYTSFVLGDLHTSAQVMDGSKPLKVRFSVRNTGKVAGAEVPQIYLGAPSQSGEPPKRLVGFQKVFLAPGMRKTIEISIDPRAANHPFSMFNPDRQKWEMIPGRHRIFLGPSSRETAAFTDVEVTASPK
jgi:beta-glucosidase